MKKLLVLFLILCLVPAGWAFGADKPASYAQGYERFAGIVDALITAFGNLVDPHNEGLEYDDPTSLQLVFFMPFLSLDMAFTNMLEEDVDESAIHMAFSFFGRTDVAFTRQAAHDYLLTFTSEDMYTGDEMKVEYHCVFSPATGAIRFVQRNDGEVRDFQEMVPLGGDRYALQNGNQRAVVSYANGVVDAFVFSYVQGEYLPNFRLAMVYDFERDGIFPDAPGVDEAWVTARDDLRQTIRLDASSLTVQGVDMFDNEKDVVIPR